MAFLRAIVSYVPNSGEATHVAARSERTWCTAPDGCPCACLCLLDRSRRSGVPCRVSFRDHHEQGRSCEPLGSPCSDQELLRAARRFGRFRERSDPAPGTISLRISPSIEPCRRAHAAPGGAIPRNRGLGREAI